MRQNQDETSTFLTRYVCGTYYNLMCTALTHISDQSHGHRVNPSASMSDMRRRLSITSQINSLPNLPFSPFSNEPRAPFFGSLPQKPAPGELPRFIKPLPSKIGPDEISYLEKKGALNVPRGTLRSEMLRAYVEFVHPYMPLLDLHDFLIMVDGRDERKGKVSLILFQAVMFAGSAFVDMEHLRAAGYTSRKDARKDFFQKTRVSSNPLLSPGGLACCSTPIGPQQSDGMLVRRHSGPVLDNVNWAAASLVRFEP